MIPQKKSTATYSLMAINIGIFFFMNLYMGSAGPGAFEDLTRTYGLVPASFYNGAWWQPVTSMFLHSRFILHIMVNMIALWSLGIAIESTVGTYRFLWLYFVSGLSGSLAVVLFQPELTIPTIGASGAVVGLLGALAIFYPNSMMLVFFIPMRARTAAILFGVVSLLFAYYDETTPISHFGHLGGLVGGFLYAKFALGLQVGKQKLHTHRMGKSDEQDEWSRWNHESQRGPGANKTDGGLSDLIGALRGRKKGGQHDRSDGSPVEFTRPDGSRERIINPTESEKSDSSNQSGQRSGKGRIYYDPSTGKFYVKE